MAANTTFNMSRIDADRLIVQQPGMTCQSHTHIHRMLGVYNFQEVVLSVILATPYFYNLTGLSKIYAAKFFKVLWRKVRRRRETRSGQDVVDAEITLKSFVLSVLGSVIIHLIAPFLTALSLWTKHRQNVNLWVIVQQSTIRPRPTCIVFPINALLGMMDFKGKPQGFVITAMSTVTAELLLCLLSINFLTGQINVQLIQQCISASSLPYSISRICSTR